MAKMMNQSTKTTFNQQQIQGEITISPTYFVTVIISSVIWPNTIFLLATFAISPKYFVMSLKSPKYIGQCFIFFTSLKSFVTKFLFHFYITIIVLHFRQKCGQETT